MLPSLRPFTAAAAERCWPAAVHVIADRGGITIDELVADPEAEKAVLSLIESAGPAELRLFRSLLRSHDRALHLMPLSLWPAVVHVAIFDALHMAARERALQGHFGFIPGLLTRMLLLPPARLRQERDLERLLTDITTAVGIAEEIAMIGYPETEALATATGPSAEAMEVVPLLGPSIGVASEIMGLLLASPRYPGLRKHFLLVSLRNAHWPTWRSLQWLGKEEPELVRAVSDVVLRHPRRFPRGARKHLSAIAVGYRFDSLPPEIL